MGVSRYQNAIQNAPYDENAVAREGVAPLELPHAGEQLDAAAVGEGEGDGRQLTAAG